MNAIKLTQYPDLPLRLPMDSIIVVEEVSKDDPAKTAIFYDTGSGVQAIKLADQYKWLKKQLTDAGIATQRQLIEITNVNQKDPLKALAPAAAVSVLRGLPDDQEDKAKAAVSFRIAPNAMPTYRTAESYDELEALIDPQAAEPAPKKPAKKAAAKKPLRKPGRRSTRAAKKGPAAAK